MASIGSSRLLGATYVMLILTVVDSCATSQRRLEFARFADVVLMLASAVVTA